MTKKKTPSTQSKAKKATVAKKKPATTAKKKPASVAKEKSIPTPKTKANAAKGKGSPTKASPAKPSRTKAKPVGSKSAKVGKPAQKRQPRRQSKSSEEGERKVREIASQTKPVSSEDKGKEDERGFSLSDVRSILSTRSKDEEQSDPKDAVPADEKDRTGKPSRTSKVKASKVKKIQTASIDDILGLSVSAVSPRPIRDEKKVPKELVSYYTDLMNLRASLKGALEERSSETLGASARESSGELSLNSADAGTETFNRDVALSMVASEQEALEEIEDAIDRVFDGTFGICQETGKPIKKTRLKVVPFTRFSLEGQNLFEKRKRREGDPVSGTFATISDSTMGQED
jgi:RNA polymerase-binding transcription factor DksA